MNAPTTHRVRAPHDGPREHEIRVATRTPGASHVKVRMVVGTDREVLAWLKAVVQELEEGTVGP